MLTYGTSQLLQEEGNPFGVRQDRLFELVSQPLVRTDRTHHRQAGRADERLEGELVGEGSVQPRRPIARSICCQQQDGAGGEGFREREESILRIPIDPLKVLDDKDDWAPS